MTEKKGNLIKILVSLTEKELELFDKIKTDWDFRSRSVAIAHVLKSYIERNPVRDVPEKTEWDVDLGLE